MHATKAVFSYAKSLLLSNWTSTTEQRLHVGWSAFHSSSSKYGFDFFSRVWRGMNFEWDASTICQRKKRVSDGQFCWKMQFSDLIHKKCDHSHTRQTMNLIRLFSLRNQVSSRRVCFCSDVLTSAYKMACWNFSSKKSFNSKIENHKRKLLIDSFLHFR